MIYPILLVISDFIALLAAFTLAYILRVQIDDSPLVREIGAVTFIQVFMILFPLWLLVNGMLGLYSRAVFEKRLPELGRVLVGAVIGILIIIGFDFASSETIFPARLVPVYGFFLASFLLVSSRNLLWALKRYMLRYDYGVRGVMVIGSTDASKKIIKALSPTLNSGYRIVSIVGEKSIVPKDFDGEHFSTIEKALKALPSLPIHTVIQTEFYANNARNEKVFSAVRNNHLQYKFMPAQSDFYTGKNSVEVLFGFPVISVHQTPLVGWGRVIKRLTDLVVSSIAMLPAGIVLGLVAIIMKIREPGAPVFYTQQRYTRYATPFKIYKLRSMQWEYSTGPKRKYKTDAQAFEAMGRPDLVKEYERNQKVDNDPRVTAFGKFLRKSSIDELPQLFNVLRGDLSLVGPRPVRKHELKAYRDAASGDVLLSVKSGITGLWQVSGRSDISQEERIRLELYYVQNWSFWLDLKILFKTVWVVFFARGAK